MNWSPWNKYLTLVPTNESKENSDHYDEKYIKIKFNSDDKLPLKKTIEIPTITIVARAIFLKNIYIYF